MADLFTTAELELYLSLDTGALDTDRASIIHDQVAAIIANYCRTTFTTTTEATEVLRVRDGWVRLPNKPVTAVTSVKRVDADGTAGLAVAGWSFDGIDRINLRGWDNLVVNLAADLADDYTDTVQVVYTYGYTAVPADVKAVALDLSTSLYNNPSGLRQETVGGWSGTWAGGNDVFGVALTAGQRAILDRYRVKQRTMPVGTSWR